MWADVSFDVRSFSPDSFGPSWGLTWEAAQDEDLQQGGGGEQSSRSRKATRDPDEDYRDEQHFLALKQHGTRMYATPANSETGTDQSDELPSDQNQQEITYQPISSGRHATGINREFVDQFMSARANLVNALSQIAISAIDKVRVEKEAEAARLEQQGAMLMAAFDEFF